MIEPVHLVLTVHALVICTASLSLSCRNTLAAHLKFNTLSITNLFISVHLPAAAPQPCQVPITAMSHQIVNSYNATDPNNNLTLSADVAEVTITINTSAIIDPNKPLFCAVTGFPLFPLYWSFPGEEEILMSITLTGANLFRALVT